MAQTTALGVLRCISVDALPLLVLLYGESLLFGPERLNVVLFADTVPSPKGLKHDGCADLDPKPLRLFLTKVALHETLDFCRILVQDVSEAHLFD